MPNDVKRLAVRRAFTSTLGRDPGPTPIGAQPLRTWVGVPTQATTKSPVRGV